MKYENVVITLRDASRQGRGENVGNILNCREQENGGGEANQRRERRRKGREHDQMTAASTVRGLSVRHWKAGAKAKSA